MNADELMKKIIAYGADEKGIKDRFGDNAELYELCFCDFLEEKNFAELDTAMAQKDYKRAFNAAHALKGISGNLGVYAFYDAVCALVEALREDRQGDAEAEYANVRRQKDALFAVFAGKQPKTGEAAEEIKDIYKEKQADIEKDKENRSRKKIDKYVRTAIIVIIAAVVVVVYMFARIGMDFSKNIVEESGSHLTEMSNQIKLYIEEEITNDWRVARSVCDSVKNGSFADDEAVLSLLQRKQTVWEVSDIMLYTESGYCVYADGSAETNDVASDTIDKARKAGQYMSVIDSKIIYTLPVETQLLYSGSKVAAISVVQDMKTFLDEMNFSSFGDAAWMYLTDENGVVISVLSNAAASPAFNFKSVISGMQVTPLSEETPVGDVLSSETAEAFLVSDDESKNYVVSVPIETGVSPLRLFYLAPESVVNSTMNDFSWQLTAFSVIMITIFGILAFLTFLFIYRNRKKMFDKAIMARERMLDLLIKNTRTAFALFTANRQEPAYISVNALDVVGDRYWAIDKTEAGYCMRNDTNTQTDVIKQANEMLAGWDGKSPFKSGYIKNETTIPPCYIEIQLYPVDGEGRDFVGMAQDVTQTFEREEATKNAMEMATRANEAKSRFLSNMSHDIRTPMNAIMNMTNFSLESIDEPKKLGQYLHTIHESSEHLLHIINDVLDMSRIESGQTVVTSAPFDIKTEIQRQADMLKPLCGAKRQTLITDFDRLGAEAVCGDALKLSQIIMNLLSNAVKFTPEKGAVRFTAEEIPSLREDIADVRFTIEDNGIGISQENLKHIFDPFARADDNRVNKIEGTGLGLSICKSYVDAMGGTIRCESEEGEGSVFTVELFFEKADAAVNEEEATAPQSGIPFLGYHCLVAEDNTINQMIAKTLLERVGFIADFADDGAECVKKFLNAKPGTYDVIYMDIQMPVLDGCQATVTIRSSAHPQANTIPIIAMTANVFAEDIEKARVAGMDAFVGKPIVSFDLIEQTNKAINKKRGQ